MKPYLLSIIFVFAAVVFSVVHVGKALADSETAIPGKTVVISVTADGTQPFTYQWLKNGVPIAGASSSSYVIAKVSSTDAATYTVRVSNAFGTTLSDNAVLTVDGGTAPTRSGTTVDVIVVDLIVTPR